MFYFWILTCCPFWHVVGHSWWYRCWEDGAGNVSLRLSSSCREGEPYRRVHESSNRSKVKTSSRCTLTRLKGVYNQSKWSRYPRWWLCFADGAPLPADCARSGPFLCSSPTLDLITAASELVVTCKAMNRVVRDWTSLILDGIVYFSSNKMAWPVLTAARSCFFAVRPVLQSHI